MTPNYSSSKNTRYKSAKKNPPHQKNTHTWEGIFKILAALISLVGISLTLLGYGVILALTDAFGLDVADVYRSPIDFLLASKDVVVMTINHFPKVVDKQSLKELWLWDYAIVALSSLTLYSVYKLFLKLPTQRNRIKSKAGAAWSTLCLIVKKYNLDYPLVALSTWAGSWIFVRGSILLVQLMVVIVAFFPVLGFFSGRWTTQENIVKPVHCQAFRPHMQGSKKSFIGGAICLRVTDMDGNEIARGRRIARTVDQLFLFNKITGKTISIPMRNSIVEQVEFEELNVQLP